MHHHAVRTVLAKWQAILVNWLVLEVIVMGGKGGRLQNNHSIT